MSGRLVWSRPHPGVLAYAILGPGPIDNGSLVCILKNRC
jgi:hypothetical protein